MRARTKPDPPESTVRITDVRGIRALAHPARLAIIDALYLGREELTATECATLTGLSPSATSYHLRALERSGIVVRADSSSDGRERPWRAAGTRLDLRSDDPRATGAAESALLDVVLDRDRAALQAFVAQQDAEPVEWRDATDISTVGVWLTADELRELTAEIHDSWARFRNRRVVENRPEGARRVRMTLLAVPVGPPASPRDPEGDGKAGSAPSGPRGVRRPSS
jgi:DNA-binding transcriptional ArsR family regulator